MLTRNSDSTFEQRATFRQLAEQAARQRNLESIMVMASRHCQETAAGGEMDSDWLTRFLQLAEEISMLPMQQLWGRIFALEVATPGRFSIRALTTLKEMTQREAQLFQRICALCCHYEGSDEQRLLLGMHKGAGLLSRARVTRMGLGKYRIPYSALLLLFDLGLLHRGELESGPRPPTGSSSPSATSAGACASARATSPCSITGSPHRQRARPVAGGAAAGGVPAGPEDPALYPPAD